MALDTNLRRILQTLQGDIAISVQLRYLLPKLSENGLLTDAEYHGLFEVTHEPSYSKNSRLLNIILGKGEKAFDLFVEALRKEKEHTGHQSLADRLQKEKEKLKPDVPSRNRTGRNNKPGISSPRPSPRAGVRRQTLATVQEISRLHNSEEEHDGQQINNRNNNSPTLQRKRSKLKISVETDNPSEVPKLLEGIHGRGQGGQLVNIENDVKTVKVDVKTVKDETTKLKETVTNLSQQLNTAMETVNDQLEKLNTSRNNDEYVTCAVTQDENTSTPSLQVGSRMQADSNDYIEEDQYMVPQNSVNRGIIQNKPPVRKPQASGSTYTSLTGKDKDKDYAYVDVYEEYTKPNSRTMESDKRYAVQEDGYTKVKDIAEGESGRFWLAKNYQHKVVFKRPFTKENLEQEVTVLRRISHPNVIKILMYFKKSCVLIYEHAEKGNLHRHLTECRHEFGEQQFLEMAFQVACGMMQLENNKIIHCDLRTHNVLVDGNLVCKVASFNKALCLEQHETSKISLAHKVATKWQPPEVLRHKQFSCKSDVWAYGALLIEIFSQDTALYPALKAEEVKQKVLNRTEIFQPNKYPAEVCNLIRYCFKHNCHERRSFKDLTEDIRSIQKRRESQQPEFS